MMPMPTAVRRIAGVVGIALGVTCAGTAPRAADTCGMSTQDWCPAPAGDPCGRHHNAASCRADSACTAMPYRGESVIPCVYDQRGFPTNCPVVGCIGIGNRRKL
jgi:hypothetical protein